MKNIRSHLFVTGASGFIGKNFISKVALSGNKVFALSRSRKNNKSKNISWLKGEIDHDLKKYLKKSHTIVHFSAAGVNNKTISLFEAIKENVVKPQKFLIDCIRCGCKKWIIIGSASEYGKAAETKKNLSKKSKELPETNYEKSKFILSKIALNLSKKNKIKCRVMRIFNVYGKGESKKKLLSSLNKAIKLNKNFTITSSNQKKDFIEIGHVTDVLIDSLNFKKNSDYFPQIWHVASGKSITVKDFVTSKIEKKFLKKIKFRNSNKEIRNFVSSKNSIWKLKND